MILSKNIVVSLNLVECKLKRYTAALLKKNSIDLTPEQFLFIDLLWNQGPMTQQALADAMQKDKNSITKLADALESKGYIVRQQNKEDRRCNCLVPTDKAISIKDNAKEAGIGILDNIIDGISEKELNGFLQTLGKIADNME